jgi:hypothetical protein
MLAAAFTGDTWVIAAVLLMMAALILAMPIANPISTGDAGMRDSRRVARTIGLVLVGLAAAVAYLGTR